MMKKIYAAIICIFIVLLIIGCGRPLAKNFYILNFVPDRLENRRSQTPYPITLRLRPFAIERAYARTNMVYRLNPFQLDYYPDHLWAVRPADMITDLISNHLESIQLVRTLVRRLDERGVPDFELSGTVLAIEEFDSGDFWYAHLRIAVVLTDFRTGQAVYSRIFSNTRRTESKTPLSVVKTLSEIMDFTSSNLMRDLDNFFYGALMADRGVEEDTK